jgi:transmembrane sensor
MSNGRKSTRSRGVEGKGLRRIGVLVLTLSGLLRVDSGQWWPLPAPGWSRHVTQVGRVDRVILQDGSQVDLNTDSEIKVRFTDRRREVLLLHGEALFTVERRPNWPFAVRAGVATVRAAGAKVSLRLREAGAVDILVMGGHIAIDNGNGVALRRVAYQRETGQPFATASAGELLSMNPTAVLSRVQLTSAALARRTAWIDGWLWFAKEPLPEALAEFNRYHRQRLVLVDPALASLEIGGRFRSTDLDGFLAALQHSFAIRRVSPTLMDTAVDTVYLSRRCGRAQQQCNWPLVQ